MIPDQRFLHLPKHFWANVRTISEQTGYTVRGTGQIKVPVIEEIKKVYEAIHVSSSHLFIPDGGCTPLGLLILSYFQHRAVILNKFVEPRLMNAAEAKRLFDQLRKELSPTCPLPMNKQKGKKKNHAYLTCIVNMLIEASIGDSLCEYDPRQLTTVTSSSGPVRTMARRVDGAFPSAVNPVAIWEIKEYYHTTTFGSRVADGVYETLLDGMELEELREHERIHVLHYLIVDSHFTWWECGRSYLCRIVDMLHMGYVDEVLFGSEVLDRLPEIARNWARLRNENARAKNGA